MMIYVCNYINTFRIPCKYCTKAFLNKETLEKRYNIIHRIEKNI